MTITLSLPSRTYTLDAIICDMDGLLIDSEGPSAQAWRDAMAAYDVTLNDDDIDDMFGLRIDEDAALLIQRYDIAASVADLVAAKSARMLELVHQHLEPMPGATQFVNWLVEHDVTRALATSGLVDYAAVCLEKVGFADAFALRVTGGEVPRGKPAPDIFLEAASRLGVAPERCLVFEDAPHGVAAANAAGMPVIAVPNAETIKLTFPPFNARAVSLKEALTWLSLS